MNSKQIVFAVVLLGLVGFFAQGMVYAQSQSLTSTIMVTVRANPQTNLLPNDENTGMIQELVATQVMQQPCIRVNTADQQNCGQATYSIADKL